MKTVGDVVAELLKYDQSLPFLVEGHECGYDAVAVIESKNLLKREDENLKGWNGTYCLPGYSTNKDSSITAIVALGILQREDM